MGREPLIATGMVTLIPTQLHIHVTLCLLHGPGVSKMGQQLTGQRGWIQAGGELRRKRTVKALQRQHIISHAGRLKQIQCKAVLKNEL